MHELTEKMRQRDIKSDRWDDLDSIIRTYLEEKAKELNEPYKYPTPRVEQILGLSPSKEVGEPEPNHCFACSTSHKVNTPCPKPKDSNDCGCKFTEVGEELIGNYCIKHDPKHFFETKPKDSEVWCSHIISSEFNGKNRYWHTYKFAEKLPDRNDFSSNKIALESEFNFCPICGTPRPTPKTLRDILNKYTEPRKGFGDALEYCVEEIEEYFNEKL